MNSSGKITNWTSRLASRIRPDVAVQTARRDCKYPSPPPTDHQLTLYEYEASPWCRLVREYSTILDLKLHIRPCPRQTLFLEGAFDANSRFRPEAMDYVQKYYGSATDLTFPLLVDQTESITSEPMVILQSYDILQYLWEKYGQSVLTKVPRPDQLWNSNSIPFALRFLLLAGPSYLRPWPTCGLLRTPSLWPSSAHDERELVLYQSEGCPESRLVRETLCTLEIPFLSIPMGVGSTHFLPDTSRNIPVLDDGNCILEGAKNCQEHLWKNYKDPHGKWPQWWDMPRAHNLGRAGSFSAGALVRGNVPLYQIESLNNTPPTLAP